MLLGILLVLAGLSVAVPYGIYRANGKTKGKQCLLMNVISFFGVLGVGVMYCLGAAIPALAAPAETAAYPQPAPSRQAGAADAPPRYAHNRRSRRGCRV